MAHPSLFEADISLLFSQLSADLAQARSMDEAATYCAQTLQTALTPFFCQLVWGSGDAVRRLGPHVDSALIQPHAEELALLRVGQPALRVANEQVLGCFAALRARGELLGWLYVDQPVWGAESAADRDGGSPGWPNPGDAGCRRAWAGSCRSAAYA